MSHFTSCLKHLQDNRVCCGGNGNGLNQTWRINCMRLSNFTDQNRTFLARNIYSGVSHIFGRYTCGYSCRGLFFMISLTEHSSVHSSTWWLWFVALHIRNSFTVFNGKVRVMKSIHHEMGGILMLSKCKKKHFSLWDKRRSTSNFSYTSPTVAPRVKHVSFLQLPINAATWVQFPAAVLPAWRGNSIKYFWQSLRVGNL